MTRHIVETLVSLVTAIPITKYCRECRGRRQRRRVLRRMPLNVVGSRQERMFQSFCSERLRAVSRSNVTVGTTSATHNHNPRSHSQFEDHPDLAIG